MKKRTKNTLYIAAQIILAALVVFAIFAGIDTLGEDVDENQLELYETSLRQYAAQCYSIEGFFPEDLSYIEENYGLNLNTGKYVYHYGYIGSNIMPDIRVFLTEKN